MELGDVRDFYNFQTGELEDNPRGKDYFLAVEHHKGVYIPLHTQTVLFEICYWYLSHGCSGFNI
jgi:hypothetical protein